MDEYDYGHRSAKIIVSHLNDKFGQCIKCNFDKLKEEYPECLACSTFNYNLKLQKSSIDC